ncbi:MAG: histidine kinase [Eubacteriales bacterium]|nr:histidine kinase [Eubacteriales bacterium]
MKHTSDTGHGKRVLAKRGMFSLKRQIVGAVWFFIVVVALLLITLLASMINSYQKKADEKRTKEMIAYAETLELNLAELRNVTGEIYSQNSDFDGINIYSSQAEKWDHVYDLLNVLNIQVKSNKGIAGLFLYYDAFDMVQYAVNDSVGFTAREELKEAGQIALKNSDKVYTSFIKEIENEVWYNIYMKKAFAAIGGCIQLSQGLPDEKENDAVYGIISGGSLYKTWSGDSTNHMAEDEMLSSDVISALQPGENHIDSKAIYLHELNSEDMAVVEILPESIWLYVNKIHVILMILIVLYIIAAFRIQKFVYAELSRPLEDMTKALSNIREGVWEVQFLAPNRISEIEDVRSSVKTLLAEIEQYKIRFYEEELEKAKIHRQYLQLQLAPHFYTNCLKNAYYMLALKEYDNAEIFLQRLSSHLRYLLQKDAAFVKTEQELEFVRNYVDLQKLMTNKPLSCKITADDEAMEKEIPILSLQTFVENSVKYGRSAREGLLLIEISIKFRKTEEANYLDITVKDNGPGYTQELLDVINDPHPAEKEGLGVGIINLQSRIRLFYGDRASWYFENQNGAVSELLLPERTEE